MIKEFKIEKKFDKLSNLREQLRKVEPAYLASSDRKVRQAREGLISALRSYTSSRFHVGRTLCAYKELFKAEQLWMQAAKIIATSIDRDERTIFRIIDDFEWASHLPAITIDALQDQNIDPAAGKNALIVEDLLQQSEPETQEQAAKTVARAVMKHSIAKKKKAAAKSTPTDFREFAEWMVKKLEDRYRSVPLEEKEAEIRYLFELANSTLRLEIRELRQFSRTALVPRPEQRRAVA